MSSSLWLGRKLLVTMLAFVGLLAVAPAPAEACMPGALRERLAQIRAKFGPVKVISTHRPGARIAGTGKRSYHASCRAVDFVPARGTYGRVAAWLKSHHNGGVGTYSCGMHHIHIDTGPRYRFHKCGHRSTRYASKSRSKRYAYSKRSKGRYASTWRSKKRYASKWRSKKRYSHTRSKARKRYTRTARAS
ncbi:MAG: YcbK family protein [Hyphomicrobiaceae bacterium]